MRKSTLLKIAVSPLVMGIGMVGCTTTYQLPQRSAEASARLPDAAASAGGYAEQAQQIAAKGDFDRAVELAEKAVELSPRDVGYRMILADLYMKNGRFLSAKATYADVLALQPESSRARFNLALTQIALGENMSATVQLDRLAATESAADLGLAYALAGDVSRALSMLEPAVRSTGADARARQNLALAYALAGDWQRARTTAAHDLSPADLQGRMEQWASFVRPTASHDQVASLLGVTPIMDQGQPVRLALAPEPVQPVMQAAVEAPAPEPIQMASAEPVAAPLPAAPATAPAVTYAEAAQTLVAPVQAAIKPAALPASTPVATFAAPKARRSGAGRYVVQLGAYKSEKMAEAAWSQVSRRYGLGDYSPVRATVSLEGKGTFHRLSVGGFMEQGEALRACRSIKEKGGACFVRSTAGDSPIRFADRGGRNS